MENSQLIIEYAPIILVVIAFIIQQRIVVTPEQLEKKHREILEDVEAKYVTKAENNALIDSVADIKEKTDKIYDIMITNYAQHRDN